MHDDRPDALPPGLTGQPSVVEATEEGRDAEVLWMLCRRAGAFRRAGRERDALSEATAAVAWDLAVRAGDPVARGEDRVPAAGGEILGLALEQASRMGDHDVALRAWDEAREAVLRTLGCELSPPAWEFMAIALRLVTAQAV